MSPTFLDAIALTHRPDMDVLFLRWPQPVYAFTPREVYTQVLELAQETKVRYWLFDIRSRGPLSLEDAQWVKEVFYPTLHEQINRHIYVAYLLTPGHAEDPTTVAHAEELRQQEWFGQTASFEGFTSETDAMLWLKKCQLQEVLT
ncbi:hypothetical protein GU926_10035 [Nibribacter ruber]|uniref:STAS/SEC14 domain-containing protein n=1 Tax=Nibribacter ruber TaxID=2698458 RepID=A0A6P1NZN9_9BACT|nr:hypothetical protein [Nibribacter ruber]QHL87749.1 hypothetical protein GU926_10035 [Nibribacter ruber]